MRGGRSLAGWLGAVAVVRWGEGEAGGWLAGSFFGWPLARAVYWRAVVGLVGLLVVFSWAMRGLVVEDAAGAAVADSEADSMAFSGVASVRDVKFDQCRLALDVRKTAWKVPERPGGG